MSVHCILNKGLGIVLLAFVFAPLATQASNRCHGNITAGGECSWFSENPKARHYGKEKCIRSYMETKPLNYAQCQWVGDSCVAGSACHIKYK